ncbi:hypothetical protein RSAG8_04398, partial [Rhizoctonia solani AG-8 WAC10335]
MMRNHHDGLKARITTNRPKRDYCPWGMTFWRAQDICTEHHRRKRHIRQQLLQPQPQGCARRIIIINIACPGRCLCVCNLIESEIILLAK